MRESELERYFCSRLKKLGCLVYKFVSPGNAGVPDRLVVLPGGITLYFEMKAPGGKPRALQQAQIARLEKQGCTVDVIDSRQKADRWIAGLKNLIAKWGEESIG